MVDTDEYYEVPYEPEPSRWDNDTIWLLLCSFAWIVGLGLGIWLVKGGWL